MAQSGETGRHRLKRRLDQNEGARQWNLLTESVARLWERGLDEEKTPIISRPDHPFKIRVQPETGGTFKIIVREGRVYDSKLYPDLSGNATMGIFTSVVAETEFTAIAATSTHGIWLELGLATPPGDYYPAQKRTANDLALDNFGSGNIVKNATYNTGVDADYTALIVAKNSTVYSFIGRVAIAASVVTIIQDIKENVFLYQPTYLKT